ncbi:MAG TPA: hypothetical protein VHE83_11750 [Mycobacteriales bacterium]|nr:hypothetical protein [Mycobacteriales bacterium]
MTEASGPPHLPWALRDLSRLVWFEVVSLIAILGCFVGARHTHVWDHQLYFIVGGITALLLAGAGWATWVLIGARALRDRQRAVATAVLPLIAAAEPASATTGGDPILVSGPGMTHFHRVGCAFTEGRAVTPASAAAHVRAGLTPCGICRP